MWNWPWFFIYSSEDGAPLKSFEFDFFFAWVHERLFGWFWWVETFFDTSLVSLIDKNCQDRRILSPTGKKMAISISNQDGREGSHSALYCPLNGIFVTGSEKQKLLMPRQARNRKNGKKRNPRAWKKIALSYNHPESPHRTGNEKSIFMSPNVKWTQLKLDSFIKNKFFFFYVSSGDRFLPKIAFLPILFRIVWFWRRGEFVKDGEKKIGMPNFSHESE